MNEIVGKKFRHKRTGNDYVVEECLPIKLRGVWLKDSAVIYFSVDECNRYIRVIDDFMDSFELVKEKDSVSTDD